MAEIKPTSFRLAPPVLDVLDAWAAWLTIRRQRPVSRADVIEVMVRKVPPPTELGVAASAVRVAHSKLDT